MISLLGWITLAKAGIRLFFTNKVGNITQKTVKSKWYWFIIAMSFIVGVWSTYRGFGF